LPVFPVLPFISPAMIPATPDRHPPDPVRHLDPEPGSDDILNSYGSA